jgi:putative membrane protein
MTHYGFWGGPQMGWWGWGIGSIFSLVFWVLLIFLLVALFRHWSRREETGNDSAMKILRERYAKGEIGKKEFEEMKKDIG